jgi:beta-galactosidase
MKDAFNALNVQRQPGPLVDLLGGRVEQFYALEDSIPVSGEAGSGQATIWAEALSTRAPEARVLLRYAHTGRWTDDQPAVITRQVGKGSITYVGAWLDPALMAKLAGSWLTGAGIVPVLANVPAAVEVCERTGNGHRVLILINHANAAAKLTLPAGARDVLHDAAPAQPLVLAPHDVGVFEVPAP